MNEKTWDGTLSGREEHKGSEAQHVKEAEWGEYEAPKNYDLLRRAEELLQEAQASVAAARARGASAEDVEELEKSQQAVEQAVERFQALLNDTLSSMPGTPDAPEDGKYH